MKIAILAGVAALALAAPAAAENWQSFSRTPGSVFMADFDSIAVDGEVTAIKAATVPRNVDAGDYSYSVETYQFRCAGNDWRTAGVIEYGPDGAEFGQYPEDGAAWETVRPNTLPAYLKAMACNGDRPTAATSFPTIRAFVDAGRP